MNGSSLYQQVAEDIRSAIATGQYPASTKLPSENELAQQYGVSRGTIRQAFAALRADGVIASRRGARRVVFGGSRVQSFGELLSFSRWARAMGEEPGGRVLSLERRTPTADEAARLAVPEDGFVYCLTRVRLLSGRPAMVERAVYPEKVGALVAGLDLTRDSITERLEELGVAFTDAEHIIDAMPASAEDARLLEVRPGTALLRERRFTTDRSGQPVESSDDRYLGTVTAFSVRNSVSVNALSRTSAPAAGKPGNLGGRDSSRCRESACGSVPAVTTATRRPHRTKENMMARYLLLKHYRGAPAAVNDVPMDQWTPEEVSAHMQYMQDFADRLESNGEYVDGQALSPSGTFVRYDGEGRPPVTDGPFAETKDLIAGWMAIDVDSYERALTLAAELSAAPGAGGKPIHEWLELRPFLTAPPTITE